MAFSYALHSTRGDGMMAIRRMRMGVGFRQNGLHFRHRDHRQKPDEHEEQRGENPKRADESPDVDPGWDKHAPRGREKVPMQAANDDDETLEPHSRVHTHADEIHDQNVSPAPAEPEELRRKDVAKQHSGPPVPPIGTK